MVLRPAPEKKVLQFRLFLFQKSNFFNFYDFELFLEAKVFFRKRLFCRWRQFFFFCSSRNFRPGIFVFGFSGFRNFKFRNLLQLKFFRISKLGLAAGVLVFRLGGGMATPSRQE